MISIWNQFVETSFLPKLLRQPNHLLWLSIRHQIHNKHLSITLQKVSAHTDDMYNIQVDFLAKEAFHSPQLTMTPMALLNALCIILYDSLLVNENICHFFAPCIILYDSFPVDENIRHFFKSIYEARNFLNFCSLSCFSHLAPVKYFDWEGILFWLSHSKVFTTHHNGQKGLLAF